MPQYYLLVNNCEKRVLPSTISPQEMLELGVFGGWYFKGNIDEYPKAWFKKAKISSDGGVSVIL